MTDEDETLFRRAQEAELQSWLDHTVFNVVTKKVADKDRVMRARWLLTVAVQRQIQGTMSWNFCRSIIHYTSYLRTKDCTNNGYVTDMLEHNTMINIDTGVHMISYITQT